MGAPRILVVDDDPNMQLLIRFNLEQKGYTVDTAGDGAEGLARAQSAPFDLVILDVMLPEISGFDLCEQLRREYDYPVLLLTARSQMEDFEQASRVGATDYILKPFDPLALADQVASHLASRGGAS